MLPEESEQFLEDQLDSERNVDLHVRYLWRFRSYR